MIFRNLVLAGLCSSLLACVGHYRYESAGAVQDADGVTRNALLYWYADDGRLWYGKAYKQVDSSVGMIVCGIPPKSFDGVGASQPMILKSRSGDRLVASDDGNRQVVRIAIPRRIPPGSTCGTIGLEGAAVASDRLVQGRTPAVSILCDNPEMQQRYPAAGFYPFDTIARVKVKNRAAPDDFCSSGN